MLTSGGQVLVPAMDVLDVGRMAVFTDPVGAVFSVWQAGTHPGAELVNEPGTWSWSELLTTDVEASKGFYGDVFGWGAETHGAGPMGGYTEWQVHGRTVAGMMQKPPMLPGRGAAASGRCTSPWPTPTPRSARVADLGGSVVMPPTDIEPGRFATVTDPFGAVFNVIALSPQRRHLSATLRPSTGMHAVG